MTHSGFSAAHVERAARRALAVQLDQQASKAAINRLGRIIDMCVDLNAQWGANAQIVVGLKDHRLLHGHFGE